MLTKQGYWSLRWRDWKSAKLSARRGTLGVGKDSKAGAQSLPRRTWIAAQSGRTEPLEVIDTEDSIARGAAAVRAFRDAWLRDAAGQGLGRKQDEHALESRILRGVVPIEVAGSQLQLLSKSDIVNWGSQFPTIWGRQGRARYLDGLLRDGSTPWALEMKVNGGGGVGRYYRHAIAQAVLYREFIRQAEPLHFWFERHDLDAIACQAAIVIPELSPASDRWRPRLQALCDLFEVAPRRGRQEVRRTSMTGLKRLASSPTFAHNSTRRRHRVRCQPGTIAIASISFQKPPVVEADLSRAL